MGVAIVERGVAGKGIGSPLLFRGHDSQLIAWPKHEFVVLPFELVERFVLSLAAVTGDVQETYLQIGSGDFGYQNDGNWHLVSIPLQRFKAVNSKLDLSMVLMRFAIADRYSFTGKALNSNITTKINIDAIQWSR